MQNKEGKPEDAPRQGTFTRAQILVINALLCAIIVVFLIFPAIGPVKLAFMPIVAVIVSAEIVGVKNGIFSGFFFGLVSFAGSFITPSILAPAFHNPVISILPRILIGVAAYYAAFGFRRLFPKLKPVFSYAVGSAAAVITNTALVFGLILAFHFGRTFTFGSVALLVNWQWLSVILVSNSVIELAICTVITPPIVFALKKALRQSL